MNGRVEDGKCLRFWGAGRQRAAVIAAAHEGVMPDLEGISDGEFCAGGGGPGHRLLYQNVD